MENVTAKATLATKRSVFVTTFSMLVISAALQACGRHESSVPSTPALQESSQTTDPKRFYEGYWSVRESPITIIAKGLPGTEPVRLFSVLSDGSENASGEWQIVSERGVTVSVSPAQWGTIAIDGRSLEVQRIGDGYTYGKWSVPGADIPNGFTTYQWAAYPGRTSVIADFATPRVMVIGMEKADCGQNVRFKITVDGLPLKNSNNADILFSVPSTVLTIGKTVKVNVTGTCAGTPTLLHRGILKVRN
ncbi:hypothetical protein [Brevundimonas sp.]|uniref:hypothetical protein n=1 Tax=Brevundimonas sp. TaxID=1871086 RepID=UPI003D0CEFDB